ncbi:MAG: M14 family zinc carboxypeptidase [Promethearchaeota archaeon]
MPSDSNQNGSVDSEDQNQTFSDREIVLSSEFEGGNAINFKSYGDNIFSFSPRRDPGKKYSGQAYYFKFSAENKLIRQEQIKKITVTAIADYDDIWKGWTPLLKTKLWKCSGNKREHLDSNSFKITPKTLGINLKLAPQEKIFISNMLTLPYSEMLNILEDLQVIYPTFIKLIEIGRSPMDNAIYSLKINPNEDHWRDNSKPKIIVSGTAQSNEFGDYAAIMLLRRFLDQGAKYWDEFHEYFRLEFLFFQNPDGIVLGKNMVNSKGENIFFSFQKDFEIMPEENRIIWKFMERERPDLYLEYHSFFQDLKTIRPYLYPHELFRTKKREKIYKKMSMELKSYCNGAKEQIVMKQRYFSETLAYRLQEEFETLAFQFKLHSCMDLKHNDEVTWRVFSKLIKKLRKIREKT